MNKSDGLDLDSGATWQQIFEQVPLQILEIDKNGRILYMSRNLTSLAQDAVVGTNIEEHLPGKDFARLKKAFTEVARTGKAKRVEVSMILPDWSQRWFVSFITPHTKGGKVTKFIVINQDITEQKMAEQALRDSEYKFRALAEQSPNMIFINKKGRIVFANKLCEMRMGYTREEFYAPDFDFLTLFSPESRTLVQQNYGRHLQEEEIPSQEYVMMTRTGELLDTLITTRVFSFENEAAVIGIVTDITERKIAENALKQAHDELEVRIKDRTEELTVANEILQIEIEERKRAEAALRTQEGTLRTLLDSSPDAITMTDLSGNILDCNQATVMMHGYGDKKELIKKNALDLIAEQDRARAMRNMEITLREGGVRNIEYLMLRKDGSMYSAELSASIVKDGKNEISGFVAVTKDISARKASEQALLQSQAELRQQKKALEQKNIALGEIIAQVEIEKQKIKEDISRNVQRVLFPILDKLDHAIVPKSILDAIRRHLTELTSNYGSRITEKTSGLTSREVEICNMIKGGLASKDIAELLKISRATVDRHRKNIRGKLDLTNQDINLAVFLRNL